MLSAEGQLQPVQSTRSQSGNSGVWNTQPRNRDKAVSIRRRTVFWTVGLVLSVGIGWWLITTWEASPSFALYHLSVAIKSHDAVGAAYYIDFNEVTHSIAEQIIVAKASADSAKSGEPAISDEILANERISEVEPALSNTLKENFKQEVLTEADDPAGVNAALLHAIVHLQNNGQTAVSELSDEKDTVRFHMMRESGGSWRITSFDVPPKYLAKLAK